jgi:hypothetical protein
MPGCPLFRGNTKGPAGKAGPFFYYYNQYDRFRDIFTSCQKIVGVDSKAFTKYFRLYPLTRVFAFVCSQASIHFDYKMQFCPARPLLAMKREERA